MKKKYMEPQMEVIRMLPTGMLCMGGESDGEATEPGMAPELDELNIDLGEELVFDL